MQVPRDKWNNPSDAEDNDRHLEGTGKKLADDADDYGCRKGGDYRIPSFIKLQIQDPAYHSGQAALQQRAPRALNRMQKDAAAIKLVISCKIMNCYLFHMG